MVAGGTHLRGIGAHHDVTAVTAFPDLYLALGKDLRHFHIAQQRTVALLVVLFDGAHQTELLGKLRKALLLGGFGEGLVHVCPLVVFTVSRSDQIFGGIADAGQLLEPHLCVFLFVFGGLQKQSGNLLKALLFGNGGKKSILIASLRLAGESLHQIFFGLCTGVWVDSHGYAPLLSLIGIIPIKEYKG